MESITNIVLQISSSWDGGKYIYCMERGQAFDDMKLIFICYIVAVLVYLALRYIFNFTRFKNPLRFIVANLAPLFILAGLPSLGLLKGEGDAFFLTFPLIFFMFLFFVSFDYFMWRKDERIKAFDAAKTG